MFVFVQILIVIRQISVLLNQKSSISCLWICISSFNKKFISCLGVVVVAGAVVYEASGAGLILEAEMALAPEAVKVAETVVGVVDVAEAMLGVVVVTDAVFGVVTVAKTMLGIVNVARAVVDKAGEAVLDLAVVREAGGALLTGNILK